MNFAFYEHISTAYNLLCRDYWEATNYDCSSQSVSKVKLYLTNIQSFYLAGNKFLFEDFIGFND